MTKEDAIMKARLCQAAYTLATTGHCQLPVGFSPPVPVRMHPDHRPFFLRWDPLDIWGFVTTRGPYTFVVFRGTEITSGWQFMQEWLEDAVALPLQTFCGGRVHLGFYGAYMALRDEVRRICTDLEGPLLRPTIILGHSLGAALATLMRAYFGGSLTTFASPRVGDQSFASQFRIGIVVRYAIADDLVTKVPTDPPFRHVGKEIILHEERPQGFVEAHSLETYIKALEARIWN
jgi:hypothetical protein